MGKTIIDHSIRVKLKLNCLEYCVADSIASSPDEHKEIICSEIGVTLDQFLNLAATLISKGIINKHAGFDSNNFHVTNKWKNEFKKENSIEDKIEGFKISVQQFKIEHTNKMLDDFFNYWSELNKSKTKMRWELEKTWDMSKRLARWHNNNNGKKAEPIKDNTTYTIK